MANPRKTPICKNGHDTRVVGARADNSCAECRKISIAKWRKRNPEKVKVGNRRRSIAWEKANPEKVKVHRKVSKQKHGYKQHLKQRYGITPEDVERMLTDQNGCCGICGVSQDKYGGTRFDVDHDHDTGRIRGLLCRGCNTALGRFQDGALFGAALRYLVEPKLRLVS